MTDKNKQNIRVAKVCERQNKKINYTGFSKDEIKYIKTVEQQKQSSKDLDYFYKTARRTETGAIDWDNMNNEELDYFDYIYKNNEKLSKRISKMEDTTVKNSDTILRLFMEINLHSQSF